ncbi:MAG TPA: hypothetical protein VFB51_10905 [Solirubrobacterales bacterium]|nr:hypothetical protein [Solirubrobacterales bacterium]
MLRYRLAAVLAAMIVMALPLALGACGGDDEAEADAKPAVHSDFESKNFTDSTKIDNKYSPLAPGMQFVYEGRSNRGQGRLPHQVIFTVTDLTKEINGVRSVVLWDRDINNGKLLEGELALWAQDDDGNVWLMGEYPEEYDEEGKFEAAPDTWLAGVDRAEAGIMMRADPKTGTSTYRQGYAPTIGFGDVARVEKTGARDCVPTGCYDDVVVTRETNPEEPQDGFQLKYYAPGLGNTRAAPRGGKEKEILVLIKARRLGAAEMDDVRREALKLDKRAYRSQKDIWGTTAPAEQR